MPGLVDLRIQQPFDHPELDIDVDRTKAEQAGFTQFDIAGGMLVSLSGSFQTTPTFYLNPKNGVTYNVVTQTPQYRIIRCRIFRTFRSPHREEPIRRSSATSAPSAEPTMAVVNHYNIHRVIDIFGSVEGRDLGAAGNDITRIVDANRKKLPRGSIRHIRGQWKRCIRPTSGLAAGLGVAIVLVISADRGQLPVVARSVHHHQRAARRSYRHCAVPVPHADPAQRSCLDGFDHVHGGRDREQYSRGVFRQGTPRSSWRRRIAAIEAGSPASVR